jgi:hypothetical protein
MKIFSCPPRRPIGAAALAPGLALTLARAAASAAKGAGQFYPQSCAPTCAQGKVKLYPVNVSASRVQSGDYTRFSYSFARGVPSGFSRSWTIDYNLHRWSGKVV